MDNFLDNFKGLILLKIFSRLNATPSSTVELTLGIYWGNFKVNKGLSRTVDYAIMVHKTGQVERVMFWNR